MGAEASWWLFITRDRRPELIARKAILIVARMYGATLKVGGSAKLAIESGCESVIDKGILPLSIAALINIGPSLRPVVLPL